MNLTMTKIRLILAIGAVSVFSFTALAVEQAPSEDRAPVICSPERLLNEPLSNPNATNILGLSNALTRMIEQEIASPIPENACRTQEGISSFYGRGDGFAGKQTANGEIFKPELMTAAHRTLPFGTIVEVRNLANGKTVKVRINDRGPYHKRRILDLSYGAAQRIGLVQAGHGQVELKICGQKKKNT